MFPDQSQKLNFSGKVIPAIRHAANQFATSVKFFTCGFVNRSNAPMPTNNWARLGDSISIDNKINANPRGTTLVKTKDIKFFSVS